jgi:hypothetical protein
MNFDNRQKYRKQTGRQLNFDKKNRQTDRKILTKRKKKEIPDLMSIQKDVQTDRIKTDRQTERCN